MQMPHLQMSVKFTKVFQTVGTTIKKDQMKNVCETSLDNGNPYGKDID